MDTTPNQPPEPPTAQRSEVVAFQADYDEIVGGLHGRERGRFEAQSSDDADRFAVIADNFVSCINLAQGLGVLLDQRNHEGSFVLFRALYESSINLMYLYDVGDRTRNALLARAYALLEMAEAYREAGAREVSREHQRLYDKMPKDLRRALAATRKKVKNHWSGVSLTTRSERVGFKGHRIMYRGTSWEAHALALGRLPLRTTGEDSQELTMNRRLSEVDAENIAKISRQCLRQTWARFSTEVIGSPIPLSGAPPDTA
jgi:hypothetical protein